MHINYNKIKEKVDRLMFIDDGFNNKCYDWCEADCREKKETTLDQLWEVLDEID